MAVLGGRWKVLLLYQLFQGVKRFSELQRAVSTERGLVTDPRLLAVLDEIDLRARVELAKLTQSS